MYKEDRPYKRSDQLTTNKPTWPRLTHPRHPTQPVLPAQRTDHKFDQLHPQETERQYSRDRLPSWECRRGCSRCKSTTVMYTRGARKEEGRITGENARRERRRSSGQWSNSNQVQQNVTSVDWLSLLRVVWSIKNCDLHFLFSSVYSNRGWFLRGKNCSWLRSKRIDRWRRCWSFLWRILSDEDSWPKLG